MSSYKPFLVANFRTGLELDLEPWLIPQDAFQELKNAYLEDGVLVKRRGYKEFADTEAGDAIVGIMNYQETDGSKTLLVADINRLYEYGSGTLTDLDGVDVYTGDATTLVHSCNWKGVIYIANNDDQIMSFDGTTSAAFVVDIDGDTNNDVTFCRYIVTNKERLILLSTTEGGNSYQQRARWCVAGNPSDWTNDGYVDCPTSDYITGAVLIGDDILVWFSESVWWLKYTADSLLPFRWERIDNETGNQAPYFPAVRKNKTFGFDKSGIVATDGFEVVKIDQKIPDFGLTFNQEYISRCYGVVVEELRQVWLAYPSQESTSNDSILAFNYEDGSWAKYTMPFNCFGYFTRQASLTIDEITWAIDSWTDPIDAQSGQKGYPTIIGGKTNGKIYTMNDGTDDDGEAIEMIIETRCWNPFKDQGLKARLGYVDFLVTCADGHSLTVDFYLDFSEESYQTSTLDFEHTGQRAWVRIDCGATGNAHKIRLYQNVAGQRPEIHAIMPWFKPAGRIKY